MNINYFTKHFVIHFLIIRLKWICPAGDIPQIAVNKHYRGKGIARSIITDLIENTASFEISVLNVDNESKCTKDFLIKLGFEHIVG